MLFQDNSTYVLLVTILMLGGLIIEFIVNMIKRRLRRHQQMPSGDMERMPSEGNQVAPEIRRDNELAGWEQVLLASNDPKEKVVAICQIGLMGAEQDIEFLKEHAAADPTPDVQSAIESAVGMIQRRLETTPP